MNKKLKLSAYTTTALAILSLILLTSLYLYKNETFILSLMKQTPPTAKPQQSQATNKTTQSAITNLNLSLPYTDFGSSYTNDHSQIHFSFPETDKPIITPLFPENFSKDLAQYKKIPDLFAQEFEPKNIFNNPVGGKILLDDDNQISGLEINITLQKDL